jgi:hypothetical protein
LRIETPENGEKSLKSEATRAQTLESLPSAPINLRLLTATTTQLKVSWDPPEHPNGVLGPYYVYNGDCLIDQTAETQFVIAALQPSTDVEVAVCASTNVGKETSIRTFIYVLVYLTLSLSVAILCLSIVKIDNLV